jgi:hypothetical protein
MINRKIALRLSTCSQPPSPNICPEPYTALTVARDITSTRLMLNT